MENQQKDDMIYALFTVVDYGLNKKISDLFIANKLPVNFIMHGHGAADKEIYDILGFGETKKAIIISILTASMADHIFDILHREMDFNQPGTGIAFSIPVNGISSSLSRVCQLSSNYIPHESEEIPVIQNEPYALILTIVNNGYFNEVMDIAKAAGATGGTLIHARAFETQEAAKFLGITIQPEKDIVMILAPHANKHNIMENITNKIGLTSPGKGICFSLPVNEALGLGTHAI